MQAGGGTQSTGESRSRLPVFPVLLPVVLLVLGWMVNLPMMFLSEGTSAWATCVPLPVATIGTVMIVVALARFRTGASWAPWLLWASVLLCVVVSAYWIWRFENMMAGATVNADARSAEIIQRDLEADRPWMWIGALVSLVPVVGGGLGGYFWLRAARRRVASASVEGAG